MGRALAVDGGAKLPTGGPCGLGFCVSPLVISCATPLAEACAVLSLHSRCERDEGGLGFSADVGDPTRESTTTLEASDSDDSDSSSLLSFWRAG